MIQKMRVFDHEVNIELIYYFIINNNKVSLEQAQVVLSLSYHRLYSRVEYRERETLKTAKSYPD